MGTLIDQTNAVMQNSDTNSSSQRQSSQGSITSTTSNLLKQNKENNSFENLEANAQRERNRLSSMLDSYKNSSEVTQSTNDTESFTDADDFIVNRRSLDGQKRDFIVPVRKTQSRAENDLFEFENSNHSSSGTTTTTSRTPAAIQISPNLHVQNDMPSPTSQRRSIYSDYAPSIHEVNKVAYVVDGDDKTNDINEIDDDLPVEGASANSRPSNNQRKASVIKISRSSSKNEPVFSTPEHVKNKDSVTSYYSVAQSGSGSSKYPESTYSMARDSNIGDESTLQRQASIHPTHPDIQNNPYSKSPGDKIPEESESTSSFEFNIGPLKTTKESQAPLTIDRSHVTSVDPAIPSRSRRRPVSQAFIKAPVNKLKLDSQANRPRSVDLGEMDNLMSELNREIYNSPSGKQQQNSSEESGSSGFQSAQEHTAAAAAAANKGHTRDGSNTDSIKSGGRDPSSKRPLPPPPVPKHEKKPSVTYEDEIDTKGNQTSQSQPQSQGQPQTTQRQLQQQQPQQRPVSGTQHDDGFVTEDEDQETKSTKELKKKHKKKSSKTTGSHHKKRSSSSSAFKKGHFNHETLTQLLQVTEGTIIGQEFQNIGLEANEKQLLERLVDSLSRLTADMVIDSERHDESVKRLNKAIKALEGF